MFRTARAAFIIRWKNEGDDLAKISDFQTRQFSLVRFLPKKVPRSARGLYYLIEKWGDDLAKSADCQRRTLSLVCHVIKCFRAACARGLYHLIEKWRDDLAKIAK